MEFHGIPIKAKLQTPNSGTNWSRSSSSARLSASSWDRLGLFSRDKQGKNLRERRNQWGEGQGQHKNQALGISQEHVYTETRKQPAKH